MASIGEGPLTSIAFCWRLDRGDGAGLGLTSNDRELAHDGVVHRSAPGVTPAAITRSLGLESDSGEVAGALSADTLSEADLALGRWNGASVTLVAIDWSEPAAEAVPLLAGELGEVSIDGDAYSAELRGAAARLRNAPCPRTSPECRAAFGDKQCRVDLTGRTARASVNSATDNLLELELPVDDRFLFGRIRYLSGENCGLQSVVLALNGNAIALRDRPRAAIEAGTTVELREGRDPGRGVDCVGLILSAFDFSSNDAPRNYRLRGRHRREVETALALYFRKISQTQTRPGDVLLCTVAADQLHLAINCGATFVHADARLRRVVETPGSPPWPVVAAFRRRASKQKSG